MKSTVILTVLVTACVFFFCAPSTADAKPKIPSWCDNTTQEFAERHKFYIDGYSHTKLRVNQTNFHVNYTAAISTDIAVRNEYLLTAEGLFDFYQDNYYDAAQCGWISTLLFTFPGDWWAGVQPSWVGKTVLFLADYYIRILGPNEGVKSGDLPQYIFSKKTGDFDFIGYFGQGDQERSVAVSQFGVSNHFVSEDGRLIKVTNPINPGGPGYPHRFYISADVGHVEEFNGPMAKSVYFLVGSKVAHFDRPDIQPVVDSVRDHTFQCQTLDMGFGPECYDIAILDN